MVKTVKFIFVSLFFFIVKTLIERGGDVNGIDEDERFFFLFKNFLYQANISFFSTPLIVVCDSRHFCFETAKVLIENGANINAKNKDKQSMLYFIFKNSYKMPDLVDYFLEKGANDWDGG